MIFFVVNSYNKSHHGKGLIDFNPIENEDKKVVYIILNNSEQNASVNNMP